MAVTITAAQLRAAARVGDSAAEVAEFDRLLPYASGAVETFLGSAFASTDDAVVNEAVVRLVGYLYDQPTVSSGDRLANALRNSGAGAILLPYRVHRAGIIGGVAVAQAAVGSDDNPVTGLSITGQILTVTFADGTTTPLALPAGGDTPIPVPTPEGGITIDEIKEFARVGVATPPTPADLAPDPQAGRVLGLRTAGGQLETSWNEIVTQGFFISITVEPTPAQIAVGGLASAGGHVLVVPDDGPEEIWVRYFAASPLVKVATFQVPILRNPAASPPDAADNQHRFWYNGDRLLVSKYETITPGHGRQVTFQQLGSGGATIGGTLYAQRFAGLFSTLPDAANYINGAFVWLRSAQAWYLNQPDGGGGQRWLIYSGPSGFVHGDFGNDSQAAPHIHNVGEFYVVNTGHLSTETVRIANAIVAAAAADEGWRWVPVGLTVSDIDDRIAVHNADPDAHPEIRTYRGNYNAQTVYSRGDITRHASVLWILEADTATGADPAGVGTEWTQLTDNVRWRGQHLPNVTKNYRAGDIFERGAEVWIAHNPANGVGYDDVPNNAAFDRIDLGGAAPAPWALAQNPTGKAPPERLDAFHTFVHTETGYDWKEGQTTRSNVSPHGFYVVTTDHAQDIATNDPSDEEDFSRLALFSDLPPSSAGGAWYYIAQALRPFAANTPKNATLRSDLGPFADYAAVLAAVNDGSIKMFAVRLSQNDVGDVDSDFGIHVQPNIVGFTASRQIDIFPSHSIGVDPARFRIVFGATAITVESEANFPSTVPVVVVRVAVWA